MSNTKKQTRSPEELQAALQALLAKGKKEGMLRADELNAVLEEMDLAPEKIEEIYDRFDAMNIHLVSRF